MARHFAGCSIKKQIYLSTVSRDASAIKVTGPSSIHLFSAILQKEFATVRPQQRKAALQPDREPVEITLVLSYSLMPRSSTSKINVDPAGILPILRKP